MPGQKSSYPEPVGLDWIRHRIAHGEGHIPLVCTPTASQAAPIGGTVEAAGSHFTYSFSVRRFERCSKAFEPSNR